MDIHHSRIPLHFEPNQGQVAGETEWIAKAPGGTVFIKNTAVAFATTKDPGGKKPRVMRFVGAQPTKGEGLDPTGGYSNYFTGRDEKNWHSGIPHFSRVRYKGLYKGIDLLYYATPDRQIEYDLEVATGADLDQVELSFTGFDKIEIDEHGDLSLRLGAHAIRQHRPKVLQGGKEVACGYRLLPNNHVKIEVAPYDEALPLTVDPVLDFSTYIGGPGTEFVNGVAVDSAGFIYIGGSTETPATPSLNPFQQTNLVLSSPFVLKLTPNADRIIYFSTLRSSDPSGAAGLSVDSAGSPIIVGNTYSPDFPLKNAFQTNYVAEYYTAFVTKFSPDGRNLVYSSYFGGSGMGDNMFQGILDSDGNLIFSGNTTSTDIPIKNAFQPKFAGGQGDCFLTKVDPNGALVFSTYFGGSGTDYCYGGLALDSTGAIYLGGESYSDDFPLKNPIQTVLSLVSGFPTAFLAKFSADGSSLQYSTFLGGVGSGSVSSVAFNSKGEVYLGGHVFGGQFATTANAFQPRCEPEICGLLMKLDPTGQQILTSTLLSGSGTGETGVRAIAVGSDDSLYVAGTTGSADFPSVNSLFPFVDGGSFNLNVFAARFSGDIRTLAYSTFLGGDKDDYIGGLTLDSQNRLYIAGWTTSDNFPVKNAFQSAYGGSGDGFLARISDSSVIGVSPLSATPSQVQFRYVQGGPPIATQNVQLAGDNVPFTVSSDAAWITVNPQTGVAPATLSIGATQLVPANYSGTITVTPAAGTPLSIPVSMKILNPAPQLTSATPSFVPLLSADTTVTFTGSGFTPQTQLLLGGTAVWGSPVVYIDPQTLQTTMSYLSFIVPGSYQFSAVNPQSDISGTVTVSVGGATPVITSIVNAASQLTQPLAPSELIQINGTNFGPIDQLSLTIGGLRATPISFSDTQVVALVPPQLTGATADVVIASGALASVPLRLAVSPAAPGLFTADMSGKGPALIEGTPSPGSLIILYGTGGGNLLLPFTVTINGVDAPVGYAGLVPNQPGWFQFDITIPADVPTIAPGQRLPRPSLSPPTVVLSVGGHPSQAGVTLALQVTQ
jgi:uncharacterized protein (TIGR03437 family)